MILRRLIIIAGAIAFVACSWLSVAIVPTTSGQTVDTVGKSLGITAKAEGGAPIVLIPLKAGNPLDVARAIDDLFRKKVEMIHLLDKESPPKLLVKASTEVQAEIRGAIALLESNWQRWPATTAPKPAIPARNAPVAEIAAFPRQPLPLPAPVAYGLPTPSATVVPVPMTDGRLFQAQAANQPRIEAAMKKLRDAKGDDEKQAAKAALRKVLATIFEEDMTAREKQAKEIEKRLATLRRQFQERQKAANEILDLQLRVLENEANGIGFPSSGPATAVPLTTPPLAAPSPVEHFLKAYPAQERVGQLIKEGHFVGSRDGKMYAYVEATPGNAPAGSAEIRICDAATGKVMAVSKVATPVRPLEFTDEGVATREADGALVVRVPLRTGASLIAPQRR